MAEAELAEIMMDEAVAEEIVTCEEKLDKQIIKMFILIRKMIKKMMNLKNQAKQDIICEKIYMRRLPIKLN